MRTKLIFILLSVLGWPWWAWAQGPDDLAARLGISEEAMRADAEKSLIDSEQWRFFTTEGRSSLAFENLGSKDIFALARAEITGRFSIRAVGATATEPLVSDRKQAKSLNSYDLHLDGRIVDTVLVGEDFPVVILENVGGSLVLSDGEETWRLSIAQENFSVFGATLQIRRSDRRIQARIPALLYHEPSGTELHVSIYIMFEQEEPGSLAVEDDHLYLRRTTKDLAGLGSSVQLIDLLPAAPQSEGIAERKSLSRFGARSMAWTGSKGASSVGRLTNTRSIEAMFCDESSTLIACSEGKSEDTVTLELAGRPLARRGGRAMVASDWQLDLDLGPGPAVRRQDGQVINYIEALNGILYIGSRGLAVRQMNAAGAMPISLYDPATETLELSLPLSIGGKGDPQVRATLSARCSRARDSYLCSEASLADSVDSFGEVVGDRSVVDLEKIYQSEDAIASSLKALQATKAIAPGCQKFCPTCFGLSGSCGVANAPFCGAPVTGPRCQPPLVQRSTCCSSMFRASCRGCVTGASICSANSSQTLVLRLDVPSSSARALAAGAADRCPPITLKTPRVYDSGLTAATDDWSLIETSAAGVSILASSRTEQARDRLGCLALGQTGTYLVIDHVEHEKNARHIPLPSVRLRDSVPTPKLAGRLVAQFEYDDLGGFRQATLIYSDSPLTDAAATLARLRSAIEITYVSEKRHPLTVYALLEGSSEGKGESSQRFVVTQPKCCPNCPPPPAVCQ